jgi:histidinol phosphatase-like PHP family hydrolase
VYLYDFHVHCSERSACASATEKEQVQAAIMVGLSGIAFTDHHCQADAGYIQHLNETYAPLKIFSGIEITADREDWLVLGINHRQLAQQSWCYADLYAFTQDCGGIIILAHPFRYDPIIHVNIETLLPDGIEIQSINTPAKKEMEIRQLAQKHHLLLFINSDAHLRGNLGQFSNKFPDEIVDDRHLVETLKKMKQNLSW